MHTSSLELGLLIDAVVVDVVLQVALVNVIIVVIVLRLTDSVHEKRGFNNSILIYSGDLPATCRISS